ncbi:MAG TPA: A/G-specific adenine glycosylase [Candidatus Paceibacterota bacterium]|nr:A/G-specific adenine glycosylase [Candidatus Paceibacterota bacterium]
MHTLDIASIHKLLRDMKGFYRVAGRKELPWRKTRDPYHILVSEIMLQQTQVDRVIPYYKKFVDKFPDVETLAKAPLGQVLTCWSGLGYNRRAKFLHEAAKAIVKNGGVFPKDAQSIEALPGVGHYTARAIAAFAFNKPEAFVETNIRTVFIHCCIRGRRKLDALIADAEILPLVAEALTLSRMKPRDFYSALMDYGAHLKRKGIRLNTRSRHYTKQSKFKGSERELRGMILRTLLEKPATLDEIVKKVMRRQSEVVKVVADLSSEGLIEIENHRFRVPQ